jgi:hypothetical protein
MILFQRLWTTPILVDHETGCGGRLISLYFHAYEEWQNQWLYILCASIWSQGDPGSRNWLKIRICNFELDWISTLVCASPCLFNTLLRSHMSSMIHYFISRELAVSRERKKGVRKDWDMSSGCDVEKEAKQCHL